MTTSARRILDVATALGHACVDIDGDPECRAAGFHERAAVLSDEDWCRFKRNRFDPAIRLAITIGSTDVSEVDEEPAEPEPVNQFRAAAELGRAAALNDPWPVRLIRATAPLADRVGLAHALQHDPDIRAEFFRGFEAAVDAQRRALDAHNRFRHAQAQRQAERVAEALSDVLPAHWVPEAIQAVTSVLNLSLT